MGPQRILTDRRGYLTETVFDAERGVFCERTVPAAFAALPEPPSGSHEGAVPAAVRPDPLPPRGTREPEPLAASL